MSTARASPADMAQSSYTCRGGASASCCNGLYYGVLLKCFLLPRMASRTQEDQHTLEIRGDALFVVALPVRHRYQESLKWRLAMAAGPKWMPPRLVTYMSAYNVALLAFCL